VDDEQRYLTDYRSGKPYAVKRAAKSAAVGLALGLAILYIWATDSTFPASPKETFALYVSPFMIIGCSSFLVDCIRRFRSGRRGSP
jgi:hypothetical protein